MVLPPYAYGTYFYCNSPNWLRYLLSPIRETAFSLYTSRQREIIPLRIPPPDPLTVVCVSDTHGEQPPLPPGDLLIHAGDLTRYGTFEEVQSTLDWLNSFPHRHKVLVAGNHDLCLDEKLCSTKGDKRLLRWGKLHYLRDTSVTLHFPDINNRRLKIYGSPWTIDRNKRRQFPAFQYQRGYNRLFGNVPLDTDVLVSHGPPMFHRDRYGNGDGMVLEELRRARPSLAVCGHHHSGHGIDLMRWDRFQGIYEEVLKGRRGWRGLWEMYYNGTGDTGAREGGEEKGDGRETLLVNGSWVNNRDKNITTIQI